MKPLSLLTCAMVLGGPVFAQNPSSLLFDGYNDYVDIGTDDFFQITDSLSLEAWVKVDTSQNDDYGRIIDKYSFYFENGYNLICNEGHLFMEIIDPNGVFHNVYGNSYIKDDQWHHVAGTFSGTEIRIYVDGALDGQTAFAPTTIAPSYNILGIGSNFDGISYLPLKGRIDEVRIWHLVRTDAQIAAYRDSCLSGNEPGLIGYWRFDENGGTVANDATSYHHNGAVNNGVVWSTDVDFQALGDCSAAGISDAGPENGLSVFPDPMRSTCTVLLGRSGRGPCTVTIQDALGRPVRTWHVQGQDRILIDRQGLRAGVFTLSAMDGSGAMRSTRLMVL
ncbi:MAG: LamG domain-containing protein [Flavobacteriales bacterium]|nr:LamG domain-containing protein [Flavobacteriales bacterium]MCB9193119.1 LamG domain-containing protein [Flavobacteriales bacterium]